MPAGRKPRLTNEQREAVIEAYLRGDRLVDIAHRFHISHTYPPLLARRAQLKTRRQLTNKEFDR